MDEENRNVDNNNPNVNSKENNDTNDNLNNKVNENDATSNFSSLSSLNEGVKNIAGAINDNNLKNPIKSSDKGNENPKNNNNNPNPNVANKKNNADNGQINPQNNNRHAHLNNLKNKALNRVASAHPILGGALSAINNQRKRRNNPINSSNNGDNKDTSKDENNNSNNQENTNDNTKENNHNKKKSLNPLSTLTSGDDNISGAIKFLGKASLPLKIGIILIPLLGFFIILLIPLMIISMFSGLFGTDNALASPGGSSGTYYTEYKTESEGDKILHESLSSFLQSKGSSIEDFNALIASNVHAAGYGTRNGVLAAATTLIGELGNKYDVKIPYYWGGGHGSMISGAASNWGSNECRIYANGRVYDYCGLDCSGFVTWAIYNGGFNISSMITGEFQNLPGAKRVTLTDSAILEPGDLLEKRKGDSGHIVLIIGVDNNANEYICAEAAGYSSGVLFSRRDFTETDFWGVDMDGFYESQVRS